MLILVIRALLLYMLVIFSLRLMGKKQLGELQPSELVSTILISNIATLSLEDPNLPMLAGAVPILLIVSVDVIVSMATMKSERFRKILTGNPRVLIANGVLNQKEMRNLRYTIDDLLEAMRESNVFDLAEVQYAIVETTGNINFLQKSVAQGVNPPAAIIKDGTLCHEGLESAGLDEEWLRKTLYENDTARSGVFLLTAEHNGKYFLVKKEA
ncbi:MAG: DUF421 domain-containing protein [Oscillospiraceae bacterium]|jgi:uncharacterized membrane protein YcaP (DUF421 family)|nr:DUF421 domain-containing protein [Oscillospiraceae bacterium]